MSKQHVSPEELQAALEILVKLMGDLPNAETIHLQGLSASVDGKKKVLKFAKESASGKEKISESYLPGINSLFCINLPGGGKICF